MFLMHSMPFSSFHYRCNHMGISRDIPQHISISIFTSNNTPSASGDFTLKLWDIEAGQSHQVLQHLAAVPCQDERPTEGEMYYPRHTMSWFSG